MKKHNTVKVVLITMLLFLLLTWILPAAYFSSEFYDQGRVQMGLFDMFNYPLTALSYFGYIALFFILVGGFYGVLYKIPAYRSFLDKIVEKTQGKEKVCLSIMVLLIALLVSIVGIHIGFALFVPFVVAIILLMGYDKIVAAYVTVGSVVVGLMGSTYAYNNLSVMLDYLGLKVDYQIGVRFVILLVGVVLLIFNILMYIKNTMSNVKLEKKTVKKVEEKEEKFEKEAEVKVSSKSASKGSSNNKKNSNTKKNNSSKKNNNRSSKSRNNNKAAVKDEDIIVVKETMKKESDLLPVKVQSKQKTWPFVIGFILLLVILVLAFITWGENGFNVTLFDDVTNSVLDFKLWGFPLFSKILGTVNSFGSWTVIDMVVPMFLVIILLMIIYRVSIDDAFDGFAKGAKKALLPAFIVLLLYTTLVLVTYHPFQLTIYKAIFGIKKGFNIVTTTFVMILASLFNSDISYSFQSVIPYFTSLVEDGEVYGLAGIIFQTIYGLTMLVAPTSLVLMCTLSYLGVSYKEWLKNIWKLLLELFVVLLIIFLILSLI